VLDDRGALLAVVPTIATVEGPDRLGRGFPLIKSANSLPVIAVAGASASYEFGRESAP